MISVTWMRCPHMRLRPAIASRGIMLGRSRRWRWGWSPRISRHMWYCRIWCAHHWRPSDGGDGLVFMNGRFRIHAFLGTDMPQSRITGWVVKVLRIGVGSGAVADEVKVISAGGCDAERLLHQAIGLIPITIRTIFLRHLEVRVATTSALRCFTSSWCR